MSIEDLGEVLPGGAAVDRPEQLRKIPQARGVDRFGGRGADLDPGIVLESGGGELCAVTAPSRMSAVSTLRNDGAAVVPLPPSTVPVSPTAISWTAPAPSEWNTLCTPAV